MRRRIYNPNFSSGPNNGHLVRFFDGISSDPYAVNYVTDGGSATLPSRPNPDPEYLIFDGWNNPNANIDGDRDIGAMYTTVDDATWAFLDVNHKTGKTVDFHFICEDGEITLDLGDGSNPIIASVDSENNVKASHTYSDYGKYIVKITCSGSQGYTLGYGDIMHLFIGKLDLNTGTSSSDVQTLEKLYCAADVEIPIFFGFMNLRVLILPLSLTSIGEDSISELVSLTTLVLPNSLTSIGQYSISYLYSLTSLVLPSSITSIGDYSISGLNSLTTLVLPNSITSIGNYSIRALSSLGTLIVESETPPTLQAPFNLTKVVGFLGIYVPDNSVDDYKNATNWSVFADVIYPMSYLE